MLYQQPFDPRLVVPKPASASFHSPNYLAIDADSNGYGHSGTATAKQKGWYALHPRSMYCADGCYLHETTGWARTKTLLRRNYRPSREMFVLSSERAIRPLQLREIFQYYGGPFGGNLVCKGFSAPFLRPWIWRFDWAAFILSWEFLSWVVFFLSILYVW